MTKQALSLCGALAALAVLVGVDALGVPLRDETRELLQMLAWSIGPMLGWHGRAMVAERKE